MSVAVKVVQGDVGCVGGEGVWCCVYVAITCKLSLSSLWSRSLSFRQREPKSLKWRKLLA